LVNEWRGDFPIVEGNWDVSLFDARELGFDRVGERSTAVLPVFRCDFERKYENPTSPTH
jgi:hypothetical protein